LLAHEVDPPTLLEEEAARKPAELGLALDDLLVGADQVAFHAPAADEAVESPQRGIWLRQVWGVGHDGSPFLISRSVST
jgi:hypothetical protein